MRSIDITFSDSSEVLEQQRAYEDYRSVYIYLLNETLKVDRRYGFAEKKFDRIIFEIDMDDSMQEIVLKEVRKRDLCDNPPLRRYVFLRLIAKALADGKQFYTHNEEVRIYIEMCRCGVCQSQPSTTLAPLFAVYSKLEEIDCLYTSRQSVYELAICSLTNEYIDPDAETEILNYLSHIAKENCDSEKKQQLVFDAAQALVVDKGYRGFKIRERLAEILMKLLRFIRTSDRNSLLSSIPKMPSYSPKICALYAQIIKEMDLSEVMRFSKQRKWENETLRIGVLVELVKIGRKDICPALMKRPLSLNDVINLLAHIGKEDVVVDELVARGISLLSQKKISRTDIARFIDILPNSSPSVLDSVYEPLEGRWLHMPTALDHLLQKSDRWAERMMSKLCGKVCAMLHSEDWEDRDNAVEVLLILEKYHRVEDPAIFEKVKQLAIDDECNEVRASCLHYLFTFDKSAAFQIAAQEAESMEKETSPAAMYVLMETCTMDKKRCASILQRLLPTAEGKVLEMAIHMGGRLAAADVKEAYQALGAYLESAIEYRDEAKKALGNFLPKEFNKREHFLRVVRFVSQELDEEYPDDCGTDCYD